MATDPLCKVYAWPVRGSLPLFVVKDNPSGQYFITTDPYAECEREPFENPFPPDDPKHKKYENRTVYRPYTRKTDWIELLGFVMPKSEAEPVAGGHCFVVCLRRGKGLPAGREGRGQRNHGAKVSRRGIQSVEKDMFMTTENTKKDTMKIRFVVALAVAASGLFGGASVVWAVPQPNIVHILTDDLGWMDVACYYRAVHGKQSIYETPNMDRIASGGMRFMQAYSPSATCSPSRAAYMAGQYTIHTGVLHVIGGIAPTPFRADFPYIDGYYPSRLDLDTPVIADVLKDAGYVTGHIQKWHLGGRSNGYPDPVAYGFDFGWTDGKDYNDPEVWDKNMKHKHEYWSGVWLPNYPNRLQGFGTSDPDDPFRVDPADDDRPFDGVSDLAVRWLDKVKDQDKPFFLNLCPSFVHGPICTRDRKRLEYYCKKMGMPFPATPGKVTDKVDGQVNPYYASMIDSLDWQVGKILSFLETTGDPRNPGHKLIDNTYLIVSSDNGGAERYATR